ncbi:MAG: membrane protein insertase YidC [Bacilli bacterium]|nr:membrane protein insertase YidC [Bacilli bacterium]
MNILYLIFIYPIEILLETFFVFFLKIINNNGLAIIWLSVIANMFLLPLYHVAENIQKKERDVQKLLGPKVDRIKAVFKSDERYMLLRTLYRQNNYNPIYSLRNSASLFLQVPFFIAAYVFLSNLPTLDNASFLFISNLGKPDSLLKIGNISLNLLPILMTLINLVSASIYTKDLTKREKVQTLILPIVFLILLYNSPSALVLYWTFNNIISLAKNIIYKLKKPLLVTYIISVIGSIGITLLVLYIHPNLVTIAKTILFFLVVFIVCSPLIFLAIRRFSKLFAIGKYKSNSYNLKIFVLGTLTLILLQGALIPVNLISSSVTEFSFIGDIKNPINYIIFSVITFIGIWGVWGTVIFLLIPKKGRVFYVLFLLAIVLSAIVNTFIFSGNYGIISNLLTFDQPTLLKPTLFTTIVPIIIFAVILITIYFVYLKSKKLLLSGCTILLLSILLISLYQLVLINNEFKNYNYQIAQSHKDTIEEGKIEASIKLSENGKNVIFMFLDRAMGSFFPLVLEEKPELKNSFSGFTYYPNTVSFGTNTLLGAPAMFGGYEYSPKLVNEKANHSLRDKQKEALMVLPTLFDENNYSVTITDPIWSLIPTDKDNLKVVNFHKAFSNMYKEQHIDDIGKSNNTENDIIKSRLIIFSIFKSVFPILREPLYDKGDYYKWKSLPHSLEGFIDWYSPLYYLNDLTQFEKEGNYYLGMNNNSTHEPTLLQAPNFTPSANVVSVKTVIDGHDGIRPIDRSHYHVNVATLKALSSWFEYLKDNNVYDNTRIVIVADHGYPLYSPKMHSFSKEKYNYNWYVPLLLVKDFNQKGPITIDNTFMTNADAPLLAIERIVENPINPFTNKNLFDVVDKKTVHVYNGPWNRKDHPENTYTFFNEGNYVVENNIFIESNWVNLVP